MVALRVHFASGDFRAHVHIWTVGMVLGRRTGLRRKFGGQLGGVRGPEERERRRDWLDLRLRKRRMDEMGRIINTCS